MNANHASSPCIDVGNQAAMSRFRRYLVPVLLLAAGIFICGKLLLTPVQRVVSEWEWYQIDFSTSGPGFVYHFGWPWVFAESNEPSLLRMQYAEYSTFSGKILAVDVLVLLAGLAAAGFVAARHYRRRGAWFRISLRELLVTVTLVAVIAGWWMYHRRLQEREEVLFRRAGMTRFSNIMGNCCAGLAPASHAG